MAGLNRMLGIVRGTDCRQSCRCWGSSVVVFRNAFIHLALLDVCRCPCCWLDVLAQARLKPSSSFGTIFSLMDCIDVYLAWHAAGTIKEFVNEGVNATAHEDRLDAFHC